MFARNSVFSLLKAHSASVLLLIIAGFIFGIYLYQPLLGSFFLSDDFDILRGVHGTPFSWSYFSTNMLGSVEGSVYRPFVRLSFFINDRLGGLNAYGYFALNIALHLLNSSFVGITAFMLSRDKKNYAGAFLAGFIFLALGNHAEAVNWLSSRGDLLSTFFVLLALILYMEFRMRKHARVRYVLCAFFAFVAALLSKETSLIAPLLVIAFDLIYSTIFARNSIFSLRKPIRRQFHTWLKCAPWILFLAPVGLYLYMRASTTGVWLAYYNEQGTHFTAVNAARTFLQLIISNFASGRLRIFLFSAVNAHFATSFIILIAFLLFAACVIYASRMNLLNKRLLAFCALFYVFAALPVLGLKLSAWTDEGERFAYMPSAAFAIFVGVLASIYIRYYFKIQRRYLRLLPVVILFILFITGQSITTRGKAQIWQRAGAISRAVLVDMRAYADAYVSCIGKTKCGSRAAAPQTDEANALVMLGLPDTVQGAYVYRNGFFSALKLWYPEYVPNILPLKIAYEPLCGNLCSLSTVGCLMRIRWQAAANGFIASGTNSLLFYGAQEAHSSDVEIFLTKYNGAYKRSEHVEILFTPQFLAQRAQKSITFAAFTGERLEQIFLP